MTDPDDHHAVLDRVIVRQLAALQERLNELRLNAGSWLEALGRRPDALAAAGHGQALGLVCTLAREDAPLRELDARRIHELVLGGADCEGAGCDSRQPRPRTFGRTGPGGPGREALAIPHPHAGR